jgi:hypothetical protein
MIRARIAPASKITPLAYNVVVDVDLDLVVIWP